MDFMDTTSAAKDIEAVRLALGDETLNALAFSYGTQLLATYAELYPRNIRALVLDGLLDHSQPEASFHVTEAQAFERELRRFFAWCITIDCALYAQVKDPEHIFDELIEQAEGHPIAAPGCRHQCREDVTGEEILLAVNDMILSKNQWPMLSHALKRAWKGDATAFSEPLWYKGMADIDANALYARYGIECQDWVRSTSSKPCK